MYTHTDSDIGSRLARKNDCKLVSDTYVRYAWLTQHFRQEALLFLLELEVNTTDAHDACRLSEILNISPLCQSANCDSLWRTCQFVRQYTCSNWHSVVALSHFLCPHAVRNLWGDAEQEHLNFVNNAWVTVFFGYAHLSNGRTGYWM